MSLFNELKRRNVIRVAMAYVVAAWLIIQVVETILPAFGYNDVAIRYIIIVLAIAFIPTLVFSWAFEITPEGLKREVDVVREHSITRFTGKTLDRIIMVLLAVALGYFAFDKFVLDPFEDVQIAESARQEGRSAAITESYGDKSIAVLPFVNVSEDAGNEYFSDGISEELLNLLAQIPELRVISRSSSFSFKGKNIAIPTVAKQLNVAHVLEGSVRRIGDRVRITAQLIEARSDTHLWSESFDRELIDIFDVQENIAAAISKSLKLKLVPSAEGTASQAVPGTVDATAYDAYLRGRELTHRREPEFMQDAVRHLNLSLRLDNDFAPAHAQLAIATALMVQNTRVSREEARQIAIPHLDRALELEPNLAEAHGGRALLALNADDPETAIAHARKALASNPSYADAMTWLQGGLRVLGRYREADETLRQLLITDPLNIIGRLNYIERLGQLGRVEEAHQLADQLLLQSPGFGRGSHSVVSLIYEGKIAESLSWGLELAGRFGYVGLAFILVGEYDEARRVFDGENYVVDMHQGRWDAAILTTQRNLELNPDSEAANIEAAHSLYIAGRIDEALPLYERLREFVPEDRPVPGYQPLAMTMRLAQARRNAGDETRAQAALEIVRQDHAARRAAGEVNKDQDLAEAMIAAFEGHPDVAIAALQLAIDRGMRLTQEMNDPIFDDMRNQPRFVALQRELDTILAAEHDKVLQLICFNNPAPDNWQPLPETCEGVVER